MRHFSRNIRPAVDAEVQQACTAEREGDVQRAFQHLERAHVLGQASTREHVRIHWRMLLWGVRQRRFGEVVGQLIRIVGAASKTAIGLVPAGNTGGSNISPFRPLPVAPDLAALIAAARRER